MPQSAFQRQLKYAVAEEAEWDVVMVKYGIVGCVWRFFSIYPPHLPPRVGTQDTKELHRNTGSIPLQQFSFNRGKFFGQTLSAAKF